MSQTRFTSALVFIAFLAVTLVVGFAGSVATVPNIPTWYAHLAKPTINPPNGLFAPVWTALYVLMAIAAWRVWRIRGIGAPLVLWFVQLALNCAWSFIFFGAHHIQMALFDIAALWLAVAATMIAFFRIDPAAGLLFVPYLAWVSFASYLNLAIWQLNG